MNGPFWNLKPPPPLGSDVAARWTGEPATVAEASALRIQLRGALLDGGCPAGADADDVERLLLIFEELSSNGLRHGRPPVRVTVVTTETGWLLEVTDALVDRGPTPAVGRDAAQGGLGLYLVARLGAAHGWLVEGDRKHVWASIDFGSSASPPAPPGAQPRAGGDTGRGGSQ